MSAYRKTVFAGSLAAGITLMAGALSCLPASAGQKALALGVVELFTSQGCSSCPPADAVLAELAGRDNVVALAYHVDYWDYLGWKDMLGSADNTARQRAYAGTLGNASIYTPQAIVNGRRDVNGARAKGVLAAIDGMAGTRDGLTVDVSILDTGETLVIEAGDAPAGAPAGAHVVLVDFKPRQTVAIHAGENRGQTLEYRNVVNRIHVIGLWDGRARRFELPKSELLPEGNGCAVLLQAVDGDGRPGAILGAALIEP